MGPIKCYTKTIMARPTKLTEELLEKAKGYLSHRLDNIELTDKGALAFVEVQLPSIADFGLYLGISRETVYAWCKEEGELNTEFSDIVSEISQEQEKRLLNNGLGGLYAPKVVGMILSKHGYAEKTETDITSKGESIVSPEVAALTKQLNDLHRSSGSGGDGGPASPLGSQA